MLNRIRRAFDIAFEDDYVIILNKKVKLLVQPASNERYPLTSVLNEYLKEKGEVAHPCHRLDRETTGLVLFAKNKKVLKVLMREFQVTRVKKKYIALIKGTLKKKKGKLVSFIIDKSGARFGEKPKRAETLYRVRKEYQGFSMIELIPLTGRTHQLRIQLAQMGNPILGETKYALRRDFSSLDKELKTSPQGSAFVKKVNFKRLALHACFLSVIHPVSKERIEVGIDLPQDMEQFIAEREVTSIRE